MAKDQTESSLTVDIAHEALNEKEKKEMTVYLCLHCEKREPKDETRNNENYVTFTDEAGFNPDIKCSHCGRGELVCYHNGSEFVKSKQAFVCRDCGAEDNDNLPRLRRLARDGTLDRLSPGFSALFDQIDH
jgi:DNA-directed RNA polymerase subunit RPC12/RpoP